ncbi:MAG: hypothetical protein KKH52_03685 [Nanoarchaeota archaeon]|nr:hypothetical protein [Nanoarchaeota archaeon]
MSKRGQVKRVSPLSKRGQVTVFIIIGIVILFAFAGVMYFTKTVIKEDLTTEGEPIIQSVPLEFQPIQAYTDNCLSSIGERGLLVLGEQGGYIYPDLIGKYSVINPTDGDGLDLEPLKVPYWHYNFNQNSNNEVQLGSLKPELYEEEDEEMSIEAQLSRFVEEKLGDCLNDYVGFTQQGFTFNFDEEEEVLVTVGENSVNFWLKKEFIAVKGSAENEFTQFYVKVPLRLKHYYEVASEITTTEFNSSFIERQTLDLLATYSGVDINKLPPTEALTFGSLPAIYWNEVDVEEKIKDLLASNVPLLRYLGSDNFYRYDYQPSAAAVLDLSNLYQKNYDNMIVPLELGQGVNVGFNYFGWQPYFETNSRGGTIQPSTDRFSFPMLVDFTSNHYYTTYDISYPVLVSIDDPAALDGKGYTFTFALEANIRNNDLVESGYEQPPAIVGVKSMVCDINKRNTELVSTIVMDASSGEPLQAVQIGFTVPLQDDCLLGYTDNSGEFSSEYPAVYGGIGSYMKEGYLTSFYPVDTYQYKENPGIIGYAFAGYPDEVVVLYPKKTVALDLKVKSLGKCVDDACFSQGIFGGGETVLSYVPELLEERHSWKFNGGTRSLTEAESGTIILQRVSGLTSGVYEEEFAATGTVVGGVVGEIELVPGVYKVSGLVTSNEAVVIPAMERCSGGVIEALACWDTEGCCFEFEEIELESLLLGQLAWDEEGYYLTITPEELYGSSEVTFNVLGFNLAGVPSNFRVIEDLQVMGQLGNYSQQLQDKLLPRFS